MKYKIYKCRIIYAKQVNMYLVIYFANKQGILHLIGKETKAGRIILCLLFHWVYSLRN